MCRKKNIVYGTLLFLSTLWLGSGQQIAAPLFDVPLSIFFLSAPRGKLQTEYGTRQAIHTLVQKTRQQRKSEKGGVIFLQGGRFTQAQNAEEFQNAIARPSFSLASFLDYDGLSLPHEELNLLKEASKTPAFQRDLQKLPLLGFNLRNLNENGRLPLAPYRIVPVQGRSVFLSAFLSGPEPAFDSNPWKRFAMKLNRQTGIDLACLILESKTPTDPHGDLNTDSYMDPHLPQHFSAKKLIAAKTFFDFFTGQNPAKPVSLPSSREKHFAHRTFLFLSNSAQNRFYRHLAGPYICETKSGSICRIDLRLRKGNIIQLEQRFVSVKDLQTHILEEGPAN